MATPLYNLLNFRPASRDIAPADPADDVLNDFVTDADVQDAQDADIDQQTAFNAQLPRNPITNEARGVVNLKSGYDTRNQLLGGLRRTLGMTTIPQAAQSQNRIAEQNNAARNQYALVEQQGTNAARVARINAEAKANADAERFAFTANQNDQNRAAAQNRSMASQQRMTQNSKRTQGGIDKRQQIYQLEQRARALEAQAAKVGPFGRMMGSQAELLKQAQQLRQQISGLATQPGANDIAQQYLDTYPGVSGDALQQLLQQTQPDATPQDLQDLYDAISSLQVQ